MSIATIRKAFETRVAAWAAGQTPSLRVAFENAPFSPPPSNVPYARAFFMPGRTDSIDLQGIHREFVGVFQVSLVMPVNTGNGKAEALADSLDTAFPTGAPILQDGQNIWITKPMSASAALQESDRTVIPVSCFYKSEVFLSAPVS